MAAPITQLVRDYLLSLEHDGVDDPFGQLFTLPAVLADVLILAGASVPPEMVSRLGDGPPVVTPTDGAGGVVFAGRHS